MYKKVIVTIIAIIVLPLAGFAAGRVYEVYESDAKILFNNKEVDFQLPVLTIDENTYVPLREAAEKLGMTVDWNVPEWYENQKSIRIVRNIPDIDAKEAFHELLGFALPETAEVLNYEYFDFDYFGNPKQLFATKISFQEEDLEYLISHFGNWEKGVNSYFRVLSQKFGWWELLSKYEILYAYERTQDDINPVIISNAFIANPSDGQYYLYIYHY